MSLSVALQSVVYYVFACTACRKVAHRKKRREEAKKERKLAAALGEQLDPDVYRQPEPSTMNIHWLEDLKMGPIPTRLGGGKKKKNPNVKSRTSTGVTGTELTTYPTNASASHSNSQASQQTSSSGDNSTSTAVTVPETAGESSAPSHLDGSSEKEVSPAPVSEPDPNWNRKRYQRQDEALWGHQIYNDSIAEEDEGPDSSRAAAALTRMRNIANRIKDNASNLAATYTTANPAQPSHTANLHSTDTPIRTLSAASSLARRPGSRRNTYAARNPPLNDYHPPVASTLPLNVVETRWMLQPPPSAKVMSGKERVETSHSNFSRLSVRSGGNNSVSGGIRSRSDSGASSRRSNGLRRPRTRRSNLSHVDGAEEADPELEGLRELGEEYEADVEEDDDDDDEDEGSVRRLTRKKRKSKASQEKEGAATELDTAQLADARATVMVPKPGDVHELEHHPQRENSSPSTVEEASPASMKRPALPTIITSSDGFSQHQTPEDQLGSSTTEDLKGKQTLAA